MNEEMLATSLAIDELALTAICSKEGNIAWRTFFKPVLDDQESITVPAQWADFMTAKLLTRADFQWAKTILQS